MARGGCAALWRGTVTLPVAPTGQGLTLVHVFAQAESFLSLKQAKHPTTWGKSAHIEPTSGRV